MGLKGWLIPQERQFFDLLEQIAATVEDGAKALKDLLQDFRNVPAKQKHMKDIEHRGENVADDLMNTAAAALFKEKDPIRIIKFKEILERLEEATDYCEDVANI